MKSIYFHLGIKRLFVQLISFANRVTGRKHVEWKVYLQKFRMLDEYSFYLTKLFCCERADVCDTRYVDRDTAYFRNVATSGQFASAS